MNNSSPVSEIGNDVLMHCRIQPSASKTAFIKIYNNAFKFSLAAPPIDGKANKAICYFVAKQLHLPKSSVSIHSGAKSKTKTLYCKNTNSDIILKIFKEK